MTRPTPALPPPAEQVPSAEGSRLAFWLNAYNALVTRALAEKPRSVTCFATGACFRTATAEIAGLGYTPDVIEHGMLRRNARPPYSPRRLLRAGDPRLALAPSRLDPRIHFALNCGARSCPPIRAYDPQSVDEQLEATTRAYFEAEIEIDRGTATITLPGLMRLYRADFGGRAAILEFAAAHLGAKDAAWIRAATGRIRVRFARFDWQLV